MPAGELLPPGWFALNPGQFDGEDEQARAHGRWFRIATGHGTVYRALQLTPGLPREGIVLDWPARRALEGGHAGAGAESAALRLDIRVARFIEYPRCLLSHPSPAVRLGGRAALAAFLLCIAALIATLAVGIGARLQAQKPQTSAAAEVNRPAVVDVAGFVATLAGSWRGPSERLLIRNDKGVVEILREAKLEDGRIRLDQYAAAPVRLDATQRRLTLDTPDGIWQLVLLPGTRRAQLSITYPDQRNVVYE
jgi:ferric-dicitrate binding protein FerR (iron transport regulator)